MRAHYLLTEILDEINKVAWERLLLEQRSREAHDNLMVIQAAAERKGLEIAADLVRLARENNPDEK